MSFFLTFMVLWLLCPLMLSIITIDICSLAFLRLSFALLKYRIVICLKRFIELGYIWSVIISKYVSLKTTGKPKFGRNLFSLHKLLFWLTFTSHSEYLKQKLHPKDTMSFQTRPGKTLQLKKKWGLIVKCSAWLTLFTYSERNFTAFFFFIKQSRMLEGK